MTLTLHPFWDWPGVSISPGPDGRLYFSAGFHYGDLARSVEPADDNILWNFSWADTNGNPISGPIIGTFPAMLLSGTNLYIGGLHAGGTGNDLQGGVRTNIAVWNGSGWSPVGDALGTFLPWEQTWALQIVGGDLYAGGAFTLAGNGEDEGTNVQRIARLNLSNNRWVRVGNGISNGIVYAVAQLGNQIYIGGSFTNAGGDPNANYIARLEGTNWTHVGDGVAGLNGVDGTVTTLVACGGKLFVGGFFSVAGGDTNANGIAIWDAFNWKTLNGGVAAAGTQHLTNDYYYYDPPTTYLGPKPSANGQIDKALVCPHVSAIAVHGNRVYVGGWFTNVINGSNNIWAHNLAEAIWNESEQTWSWSAFGGGVDMTPLPWQEPQGIGHGFNYSGVNSLRIITNPTNHNYDLYVAGGFDSVSDSYLPSYNFARWRVGYPLSSNVPQVSITAPTNYAVFTNNLEISLIATATSYTNLSGVKFFTNGVYLDTDWDVADSTFGVTWADPPWGVHFIKAVAEDVAGLNGESKAIVINVKNPTNSISAVGDVFTLPSDSSGFLLDVLSNDTPVTNLHISQVVQDSFNFGRASISHDGESLVYNPLPHTYGTDIFRYVVTNSSGNSDMAVVTVNIRARPTAFISAPDDGERTNPPVSSFVISGTAWDSDGSVSNITLLVNGTPYGAPFTNAANHTFNTNWSQNASGFYTFEAVARDNENYTGTSAPVTLVLTAPVTNPPVASIANLAATTTTQFGIETTDYPLIREGLFDLVGTASGDNPIAYQLLLFRPEDWEPAVEDLSDWIPVGKPYADLTTGTKNYQGFHMGGVTNGLLGTLDFSGIPNGIYDLVLRVRGGTAETNAIVRVRLGSELKIGQFSFSEQDLAIPVNGIPLTVVRTYNSMNPDSADFGYSWTYALNSMDVKLDETRENVTIGSDTAPWADEEEEPNGLPKTVSIRTGGNWDVTLTLPDGRRTTFAFGYDGTWPELHAKWTAPPKCACQA